MKTIFTLLLATSFTTSAFAYDEGRISITVPSGKNLEVYVDDRVHQLSDNTIMLDDVRTGNHTIRVYSRARSNGNRGRGYGKNGRQSSQKDLVYSSTVYVRPSYHVDVVINRFGKALVDERSLNDRNNSWGDDNDDWYDNNNSYGNRAITDADFNQLLQKVRNQWIGKIGTAKDGMGRNYFQTYQVRQLLQLFSSESDKLELAKLSYDRLVDRQNFRQLYDLFGYNSQNELDRYARERTEAGRY